MSSFVVGKVEYMKAAGVMYGVAESLNGHRYFLEHCRKNFTEIYNMNVDSVNEQYNDDAPKDGESYDTSFEKYREIGRDIWGGWSEQKKIELRNKMMMFFGSVLYQIENEEMSQKAGAYFFTCMEVLMTEIYYKADGCWGSLDLEEK